MKRNRILISTTDELLLKFKEIHKDRYDYSLVEFINMYLKVKIICSVHGIFEQTPYHHINNHGCKRCNNKHSSNRKRTKEQFVILGNNVHNNTYDYSLSDYKSDKIKVKIICPIHGIFEQRPSEHLKGSGCPKCSHELQLN